MNAYLAVTKSNCGIVTQSHLVSSHYSWLMLTQCDSSPIIFPYPTVSVPVSFILFDFLKAYTTEHLCSHSLNEVFVSTQQRFL